MSVEQDRITARGSRELLKATPMRAEHWHETREREAAHRALPQAQQPYMVTVFGMLDYGILWIGPEGGSKEDAEHEAERWHDRIRNGLEILPFTRHPSVDDIQIRQQWDLDALLAAIHS